VPAHARYVVTNELRCCSKDAPLNFANSSGLAATFWVAQQRRVLRCASTATDPNIIVAPRDTLNVVDAELAWRYLIATYPWGKEYIIRAATQSLSRLQLRDMVQPSGVRG